MALFVLLYKEHSLRHVIACPRVLLSRFLSFCFFAHVSTCATSRSRSLPRAPWGARLSLLGASRSRLSPALAARARSPLSLSRRARALFSGSRSLSGSGSPRARLSSGSRSLLVPSTLLALSLLSAHAGFIGVASSWACAPLHSPRAPGSTRSLLEPLRGFHAVDLERVDELLVVLVDHHALSLVGVIGRPSEPPRLGSNHSRSSATASTQQLPTSARRWRPLVLLTCRPVPLARAPLACSPSLCVGQALLYSRRTLSARARLTLAMLVRPPRAARLTLRDLLASRARPLAMLARTSRTRPARRPRLRRRPPRASLSRPAPLLAPATRDLPRPR